MTSMTLEFETSGSRAMDWSTLRNNGLAAAVALALHGVVLGGLMFGWSIQEKMPEPTRTLTTQLFILPPEPTPAPAMIAPAPVIEPVVEPTPVAKPIEPVKPQVDTQRQARQLEQAALARKRVEEQKREQRQHAQEVEQQRQQEQQRVAQQAEQQRQTEQARQAAERARQQTAAAADSSQYQPLSKEAPDYPQRALDKGIEGDCTLIYDVSPQGRVVNPQVQGTCHPLFIRPSMTAAETFRYQPRIVEGRAVTVSGVKNTFHYRIR